MKAISRTAAAGAAAMILFTGCTSLPDHTRTKDSTMICAEENVSAYIHDKYGFEPEVLDSFHVTTNTGRDTCHVQVRVANGEEQFDVLADVYSENPEAPDIQFSDNRQRHEIEEGFREWIDEQLPGLEALYLESGSRFFADYFTELYEKDRLMDFLGGQFFYFNAYYVDHSFEDGSQLDFLEQLDEADVGYDCKFISCYSKEAVEKVKHYSFPNDFETHDFTPYIREYRNGFRNSNGKDKSRYYKFNVHQADGFMYSVMESDCYGPFAEIGEDYELEAYPAMDFDEDRKAVSPCWYITGEPAYLRIFIPKESVDYHGYQRVLSGSAPHSYDIVGEYVWQDEYRVYSEDHPFDIRDSSFIIEEGDYFVFDMELKGEKTADNKCESLIGIFETDGGKYTKEHPDYRDTWE